MSAANSRRRRTDQLAPYRDKRDFDRTPEPAGGHAREPTVGAGEEPGELRFVVQRHRARRPHYDVRLEIGGVLASWAVPKGPTLDPAARRAAFHVEDHPIEYLDFEGVIPAGEYGGGDVIVWDIGTWRPHGAGRPADPERDLSEGELHFDLFGERLRGRFALVRTRTDASGREEWLLLHKRDSHAVPGWNADEHLRSVLSGRTNDEVKADPDRIWVSSAPPETASVTLKPRDPEPSPRDRTR